MQDIDVLITGFAVGAAEVNCYLLAPAPGGPAVVIDPGEDAVPTLEYFFAANDLTPAAVLLTHGHRGHALSSFELCAGWDIPVYLHSADQELLTDPPELLVDLADEPSLTLAGIDIAVLRTPGHTPGSMTFAVTADTDEGPNRVVFTGDSLGRRTLGRGVCDHDRRQLHACVTEKLMVLDDDTVVLPGHGRASTIGQERRFNPDLTKDNSE